MLTRLVAFAALATAALAPAPALAGSQLVVSPSRVTLEGRHRAAELLLVNRGDAAATYRVLTTTMRMDETGRLAPVPPGADDRSAEGMLRYAPRQVTVGPGETQRVRVLVQRPADLEAGEYRAHLLFQAIPDAPAEPEAGGAFGVNFHIVSSIAVPVIVRHGALDATAEVASLRLDDGATPTLEARITRAGDRSLYGDVEVTWHPDRGAPAPVALVRGLAIYTPLAHRDFSLPLQTRQVGALRGGRLVLTYRAPADQGGGVLARGELAVP